MAAKKQVKKQRVRLTNKAAEALRFSTIRVPAKGDARPKSTDIERVFEERAASGVPNVGDAGVKDRQQSGRGVGEGERLSSSNAFDPIASDPMFVIVHKSKYWPPPSLDELYASAGVEKMAGDGFDSYDRREDDQLARRKHTKIVRGELNHPRGKPRQNTLLKLETSSDEDNSKEN
ncbi:hypothetical protein ERJ75_001231800 [Trypanosoma vivax]|nr:hypothetical protein TRVL_05838 [Trypanosoma vivax]KAH8609015.1 hypothetical protein ERJ75_001231800 [Trypanosoma vivax]